VDSDPVQQLSGGFLLDGQASAGELKLTTPLGTVASRWVWSPGQATMTHDGQTRQFDNMATLTEQLTGVALPLEAVFAWLQGRSFPVDGWRVDLDNWPRGRILAHRLSPSPAVELRLILDK
jgi:outer membrane lipoprotein LolB